MAVKTAILFFLLHYQFLTIDF